MSPVLGLLQFTHSRKAAFAIWCFDLTTEFQPGMLNLTSFFLPVGLIAEDAATSSHACRFGVLRCFGFDSDRKGSDARKQLQIITHFSEKHVALVC